MQMTDLIVGGIILLILALAIGYIYRAKKSGVKCIGCAAAGKCPSQKGGGCHCGDAAEGEQDCGCGCGK